LRELPRVGGDDSQALPSISDLSRDSLAGDPRRTHTMVTARNTMKTLLFMGVLTGLLLVVGDLLGKRYFGGSANGMLFFLFIAVAINFASYWWSDKIVLKVTRSRPVTEQEAPWLYRIVRELTQ